MATLSRTMINNKIYNIDKRIGLLLERYYILLQEENNIKRDKNEIKKEIHLMTDELKSLQEQKEYLNSLISNNKNIIIDVESKKVKPIKKYKLK